MEIAQTADHALRILLSVSDDGPQTVNELCERLGLARSVARRLVATLQHRSFVKVDGGQVSVGPAILSIAAKALPEVYREAQPLLDEFARDLGETVVVTVLEGKDAVVAALATSDRHPLKVEYPLGFRHPVATGAAGRAILFDLPPKKAEALISATGDVETIERFREERAAGYALSHDELKLGAFGIAVPIRIAQREGSLSIVAPASRGDGLFDHLGRLREVATRLCEI
ncbi:helix-turn-helix domain-containing protein [Nocardia cyriacigeorgica]|uniref:Helix-turn-helix domain-containing protein n=1 Tax=Nocardia cyriacigeorgica TaxID=135487 RepID=A0A6P1CWK8_9NOCA|nr:helix-turn-helix domain-containing protein [Nocardia cyriacigeorgica]NEW36043.1 helix-turn-helix domain-containing protein [Nocardia cyriacigeorgica]